MQNFKYPGRELWKTLSKRPSIDNDSLAGKVKKILDNVSTKGDKAIRKYNIQFDDVALKKFEVDHKMINDAGGKITPALKKAIEQAASNIEAFHSSQVRAEAPVETMPSVLCWRRSVPIESVGFYIPGGSAPLFSTVLMLGIPAKIAGCNEMMICTPGKPGEDIHPAICYAARLCGITKIFRIGGAQAIAAMAYGTESVPKALKIFGPGNQYVTMAKQLVQQQGTAIDMPAGPSELLIIADEGAIPEFVAADLLSQAEHGPDSQVILVITDRTIVKRVEKELGKQINKLDRNKIAAKALENSKTILVKSIDEAIDFSNTYAPEHLILACSDATAVANRVINAGSVFLGNYSPESAGDYASGTNHILPTNGYAAVYSGVSVDSFVKRITYQQLSEKGLENIAATVMEMAEAEGLGGHKEAVAVRLRNIKLNK